MRQCQCIWPTDWEIGLITPLRDSLNGKADATNSIRPLGRHENIKHGGTANGRARQIVILYVWDGLAIGLSLLKKDLSSDPTSSKTFFFSFSFVEFIKCAVMSLKRIGLSSLELRSRWMRLLSLEPKPKRVSPSEAGTKKNFCQSARAR